MKKQKGITLIALVVTIIVLIILAGISINLILGENGIIAKAKEAKEKQEQAEIEEEYGLTTMDEFINESLTGIEIEQVIDKEPGVLEGTGIETDPYVINSIEDLVVFGYNVINGNTYEGKYIKLGVSLNFKSTKSYVNALREDYDQYGYSEQLMTALTTGEGFKPIGTINDFKDEAGAHTTTNSFKGTFDGNNKVISNLYMNVQREYDITVGLFSYNYGTIKNIGLINTNIQAEGVSVRLGGICGWSYGDITKCYTKGNITSKGTKYADVGGICCVLEDGVNIKYCYNTANIYAENTTEQGEAVAGGIAGAIKGGAIMESCYNSGYIKANGEKVQTISGGIVATNNAEQLKNCYNTGKVESYSYTLSYIGGISGLFGEYISYCYNSGDIKAIGTGTIQIGGIQGRAYISEVSNVYNIGNVTVEIKDTDNADVRIGGIASCNYQGKITDSYNIGNIITNGYEGKAIGSILGYQGETEISNCIYLKGTYSKGIGDGETIEEKENISDLPKVLEIINIEDMFKEDTNNINKGYPILSWQ